MDEGTDSPLLTALDRRSIPPTIRRTTEVDTDCLLSTLDGMRGKPPGLSERGQQVALLVAKGYGPQEIGQELGISPNTAEQYITRVLDYMQMRSRSPGMARAGLSAREVQISPRWSAAACRTGRPLNISV
jgi:DNA-binding CsgD family transcriptional regulator